jgi:fumarate hydratase class II
MPGKVNRVIAEVVTQVGAQVGNDVTIGFAGAQGNQLNVYVPVIAQNRGSIALLTSACTVFAYKCVDGTQANIARLKEYAESSPSIGTALTPYIGYEAAADVIKESTRTGKSIRQIVRARKLMSTPSSTARSTWRR